MSTGRLAASLAPTFVATVDALRVAYAALADEDAREADRCGIAYAGAAGRCTGDARYITTLSARDGREVPLCRDHAEEYAVDGLPDPFVWGEDRG